MPGTDRISPAEPNICGDLCRACQISTSLDHGKQRRIVDQKFRPIYLRIK
jgi:hypothetical protein